VYNFTAFEANKIKRSITQRSIPVRTNLGIRFVVTLYAYHLDSLFFWRQTCVYIKITRFRHIVPQFIKFEVFKGLTFNGLATRLLSTVKLITFLPIKYERYINTIVIIRDVYEKFFALVLFCVFNSNSHAGHGTY